MRFEEVEELLKNYNSIKLQIYIFKEELSSIENTGVSAINYDFKSSPTNEIQRPTENEALYITQRKKQLEMKIFILEKKINIIDRALEHLEDTERDIITMRFIKNEPFYKICLEVHVSERWAREIRRRAITKIASFIDIKNGQRRA